MSNLDNVNRCSRNERLLPRPGIVFGVVESLLVGLSFYLGFVLINIIDGTIPYLNKTELILMSFGAAFSYAFVFVFRRNYRARSISFSNKLADLFWNVTYTYLVHLSILFLVKDSGFSPVRAAIGLGYVLGYLTISTGRLLLSSVLGLTVAREGRKTLIFKGIKPPVMAESPITGGNQVLHQRETGYGRTPVSDSPRLEKATVGSDDPIAKY